MCCLHSFSGAEPVSFWEKSGLNQIKEDLRLGGLTGSDILFRNAIIPQQVVVDDDYMTPSRLKPVKKSNTVDSGLKLGTDRFGLTDADQISKNGLTRSASSSSQKGIWVGVDTGPDDPDEFQPWQWSQKDKLAKEEKIVRLKLKQKTLLIFI